MKTNPLILPPLLTTRQLALSVLCCGALGILAGCASEPKSHTLSALPPPAPTRSVTTTTTTTTPDTMPGVAVGNSGTVIVTRQNPTVATTVVTTAPPALQSETVLAQPSSNHVWVPGYWTWRNDRYEWVSGHWELPPNSRAVWVAPVWEQQGNAYKFTEGYWNQN